MSALIDELRADVSSGRAVVVVGTGVSRAVTDDRKADWQGLLESGIAYAHGLGRVTDEDAAALQKALSEATTGTDNLSVASRVAELFGGTRSGDFRLWLKRDVGYLRPKHLELPHALAQLKLPIVTTNYDELLESVLDRGHVSWMDAAECQLVLSGRSDDIFHLHGFWKEPESIVLTAEQYAALLKNPQVEALRNAMAALNSMIYVGFGEGLSDPHFAHLRSWMTEVFPGQELRHYRLCRESQVEDLRREHRDDRIVPVSYGHEYGDLIEFLEDISPIGPVPGAASQPLSGLELIEDQVREATVLASHVRDVDDARVTELLVPPVLLPVPRDEFVGTGNDGRTVRPRRVDLHEEAQAAHILLAGEENVGVSSALMWLASQMCLADSSLLPIVVDFLKMQGPHGLRRQVLRTLRNMRHRYRDDDVLPPLVLILDNVHAVNETKLQRLAVELSEPQYARVLVGCRTGSEIAVAEALNDDKRTFRVRYVGRFAKSDVRMLARLIDPRRARELSDRAVSVVETHGLPGTPFTLSMILSAIIRGESLMTATSPTSLLDDYVDMLLGRGQLDDDSRYGFDARNRSFLLSCLAERFVRERVGAVAEPDIIVELDRLLDTFGWSGSSSVILDDFCRRRVFVRRGREVAFAQSSYLHLFAAKRAIDEPSLLALLKADPLYFAPVLTHYAALRRSDAGLVVELRPLLDMFLELDVPDARVFRNGISVERRTRTTKEIESRIRREAEATPQDDDDDDDTPLGGDDEAVPFPLAPVDEEPTVARLITTVGLMSNLVRDTELIADQTLRKNLLTDVLRAWVVLTNMVADQPAYTEMVERAGEEMARRQRLADKRAKKLIEDLHVVLPASLALGGVAATLSSRKLTRVLEACLADEAFTADVGLMFMATCLAFDIGEEDWTAILPILEEHHAKVLGVRTVLRRLVFYAYLRRPTSTRDERRAQDFLVEQTLLDHDAEGPRQIAAERATAIESLKRAKLLDSRKSSLPELGTS